MSNQVMPLWRVGWTALRMIAVISSSMATIVSSLLPLYFNMSFSMGYLIFMLLFLSVAATVVHGALTHVFNDYADFLSGTDAHSPALLSGGSRLIQKGVVRPRVMWQFGKWLAISLLVMAVLTLFLKQYDLAILIVIGVWAAVSYSLPPLQLSYRPFLGEWLSLFPSLFFLGLAAPWIMLAHIPLWAVQNAVINALVCMAWVMVHHIPDIDADRMATPVKRTSVVWFVDTFGLAYARVPALLYLSMAGLLAVWLFPERLWAGLTLLALLIFSASLVMKMEPSNHQQVTNYEKILLLCAVMIALVLGIF